VEPLLPTVDLKPPPKAPDASKLLESANKASENVAVLHATFIAACAYVIVIAVGRTDLDLLIGKGIRLPIVDTEVPIVGFFAVAPWILVVVHFNLLLHLQLLARKLHAFDQADEHSELRNQLRIFPTTWYLAGKTDPRTRRLLSLMISITLIILPLLSLLILQLQFLAYQSELITWSQRFAIWLDLVQLAYFWPIIVELGGSSCTIKERLQSFHQKYLPRIRDWIAPTLSGIGLILIFCGTEWYVWAGLTALWVSAITSTLYEPRIFVRIAKTGGIIILPLFFAVIFIISFKILHIPTQSNVLGYLWSITSDDLYKWQLLVMIVIMTSTALLSLGHRRASRSSIMLLFATQLTFPLSLGFQVDGEMLEKYLLAFQQHKAKPSVINNLFISDNRILNLKEERLFANHPDPEIVAQLRSSEWAKALQKIEPINLQGRSLRHANFENALLCRADLRSAMLQGANFSSANLKRADLSRANLQGASLIGTQLQGAELTKAQLQSANLAGVQLQGANLKAATLQGTFLYYNSAQFQGANLNWAQLQGAYLTDAQFQGANLTDAQLQGTKLNRAQFQGADLSRADLQGADLSEANLYGANLMNTNTKIIEVRGLNWAPIEPDKHTALITTLKASISNQDRLTRTLNRLQKASMPNATLPQLQSCLASEELSLPYKKRYDPKNPEELAEFRQQLHLFLAKLASKSVDIARGIIFPQPYYFDEHSSRPGLATVLVQCLDAGNSLGLNALSNEEKNLLRKEASRDQQSLKTPQ